MENARTGGRRLKRLLLATDRSAASRAALLAVAGLAVGGRTEAIVLHIDDLGRPEEGRRLVADIASGLIALAVDARPELRQAPRGRVAAGIAAAAAEDGCDLVVLGSRGRSDVGGLLPGGVAGDVVEQAPCPVLLVRDGRRLSGRRRRVLLAVVGDEDLGELVRTTAAVAVPDAQVLVLQLVAPGQVGPGPAAVDVVDQVVAGLRRCGVRARGHVPSGSPPTAAQTARTAHDYGADLVVVGSRRLPALARLLRGGAPAPAGAPGDTPASRSRPQPPPPIALRRGGRSAPWRGDGRPWPPAPGAPTMEPWRATTRPGWWSGWRSGAPHWLSS
jgi:nucleotide-binding universal stress UspA family protein